MRFAHDADAVLAAYRKSGFEVAAMRRATLRMESGVPVAGLLLVLRRP